MAYCARSKLSLLSKFRGFASRIVPKAVEPKTKPPISRFYSTFSSTPKHPLFSSWNRRIITTRTTHQSPFPGVSKRYFSGVAEGATDPDTLLVIVVVGVVVIGVVLFGRFETIPYSKRTHFVILRPSWEKKLGESAFNETKEQKFKGKVLPDTHPETIRVRAIANDLIGALERNINPEQDFGVMPAVMDLNNEHEKVAESSKDHVVRDDMWIEKSRKKKGKKRGAVSLLNDLKWEILVVDQPTVNAYCMPGGKIVVFTGLLNHFKSNAEIATVVGHEVGHVIARHAAEGLTDYLWLLILQFVFLLFVDIGQDNLKLFSELSGLLWGLLCTLPFSRRMEMEADYIGLLLLASAGYDPMVAPGVYKKLSEVAGGSAQRDEYLSTHPSGEKRAENLSQAKVMEEALCIYRDVKQGLGVKGFL